MREGSGTHPDIATPKAGYGSIGFRSEELEAVPPTAVESFASVGYPFAAGMIRSGDTVLDVGSGSGTDALIACRRLGPEGRVIGLDMTPAMREKLRANARAAGVENVEVLDGDAEEIPLPDGSVHVVTSKGVINLVPDKARAVQEIFRVLRPGGRVRSPTSCSRASRPTPAGASRSSGRSASSSSGQPGGTGSAAAVAGPEPLRQRT